MNCICLKSLKLPLTAAFAFAAFSAQAADMYAPRVSAKDAPVYEAVPLWTGFYAGVNAGYGWGAKSGTLDTTAGTDNPLILAVPTYLPGSDSSNLTTGGGFGGGQIGYNLQRDHFVFGIEADIQGAAIKGNGYSAAAIADSPVVYTAQNGGSLPVAQPAVESAAWAKSNLDWFGTVRGRLGYAFGSTLLYATGGLAYGGVRDSLGVELASLGGHSNTPDSASKSATLTGWAAGGGVEIALSPSWSAKAEYQYIDLGSTTLSPDPLSGTPYLVQAASYVDGGTASAKFDHTYHTARLGLNYRFNQVAEPLK